MGLKERIAELFKIRPSVVLHVHISEDILSDLKIKDTKMITTHSVEPRRIPEYDVEENWQSKQNHQKLPKGF